MLSERKSKSVTCDNVIKAHQKKGKVPTKLFEETPWNTLYVDLIGPYKILIRDKEPLMIKAVTMIDTILTCSQIT